MITQAFYDALIGAVLVLLAATIFLILVTLFHHGDASIRLRRHRRRRELLLPLLCEAISAPAQTDELLAQLRRSDRAVLLPMLLQLALDLRGAEAARIAGLSEKLGLVRGEMRRLRSLRATARARAVKNLGLLGVREALDTLLDMAKTDRQREVRLASVWAIGQIGGQRAVQGLVSTLEDKDPGVVRRAQEVMLDAAPDAAGEIVKHARDTENPAARFAAVELLGALQDPQASELLLEFIEDPNPELRTKATKAAAAIADPRFREPFRELLADPVWSVRCQAATGLGAIGAIDAIPGLYVALEDEAWWVRFNAASALADLGPPGRAALAEATTADEASRREVARYVLERTGLEQLAA
jgi:HEAT repeat protein